MAQDQRRIRKYIINLILAVLAIGIITISAVGIIRSAGDLVQDISTTSARG